MIYETLSLSYSYLRKGYHTLKETPLFLSRLIRFLKRYHTWQKNAPEPLKVPFRKVFPCLGEDEGETPVDPVYFYQDTWAFQKIVERKPPFHVDVGSHHKYVAFLSQIVPVVLVDIRPLSVTLPTIEFRKGDILHLPFPDGSVPSLSSLCVIEHIGLGRYGEEVDPYGSEKAIVELKRVVMKGGDLYISLPVGEKETIYYDAHRVFLEEKVLSLLDPFRIVEKRYIYGKHFVPEKPPGEAVACYHLRNE